MPMKKAPIRSDVTLMRARNVMRVVPAWKTSTFSGSSNGLVSQGRNRGREDTELTLVLGVVSGFAGEALELFLDAGGFRRWLGVASVLLAKGFPEGETDAG